MRTQAEEEGRKKISIISNDFCYAIERERVREEIENSIKILEKLLWELAY